MVCDGHLLCLSLPEAEWTLDEIKYFLTKYPKACLGYGDVREGGGQRAGSGPGCPGPSGAAAGGDRQPGLGEQEGARGQAGEPGLPGARAPEGSRSGPQTKPGLLGARAPEGSGSGAQRKPWERDGR